MADPSGPSLHLTLQRLDALWPARVELGLDRVRAASDAIGSPHRASSVRWILVAGTNGKGSTALALAAVLKAHGLRVGLYTSPHLVRVHERIRVDLEPVSDTELVEALSDILCLPEQGHPITYFEAVTLAALRHFDHSSVDVGILEVGLGGRLDATNIVEPDLTILTSIGLDHSKWLGDTLEAIAWEKGGITRAGVPLVSGLSAHHLDSALDRRQPAAPIHRFGSEFWGALSHGRFQYVEASGGRIADEEMRTWVGPHQGVNLALALRSASVWLGEAFRPDRALEALRSVSHTGRLHTTEIDGVTVWFDGAHNEPAARALSLALERGALAAEPLVLVAIGREKRAGEILRTLAPHARALAFAERTEDRWWSREELMRIDGLGDCVAESVSTFDAALAWARERGCPVLVTGSLYYIGEVLAQQLNSK